MLHVAQPGIELCFICYLLLVCFLLLGWLRAMRASVRMSETNLIEPVFVSVVVAVRNECQHLPRLIADLRAQQKDRFEVIIVDDHSEDNTASLAFQAIAGDGRFVILKASGEGKKSALSLGVRHAKGSIIVTTDADCRVGPNWLAAMTHPFDNPSTMMVFGAVRIAGSTLFERMQQLEFATLIGAGAATAAWNVPTMCNGANLSYRKHAFEAVGGYDDNLQIPSGDDEFLMRKLNGRFKHSIRFCGAGDAIVTTAPSDSIKHFFAQRIRWAGKWRLNTDLTTMLLAFFVFSFHMVMVALPWLVLAGTVKLSVAVVALSSKAAVEYIYIRSLQRALGITWSWKAFLFLQIVYSYYVVLVAACAQFAGFEWKGRRLKPLIANGN